MKHGLIEFRPTGIKYVYEPTEIFNEGKVCIVNVKDFPLKINDEILIEKNGKFEKAIILDIQAKGKSISEASNGELGLKLNVKIAKKSTLWKKSS